MITRTLRALLVAVALLAGATSSALAERYALLVGVSSYPSLDAKLQLDGPKNDIVLMRTVLERRGFSATNMQVLADGVPGAGEPSRAAILAGIDALVAKSRRGDFVMIYMAGHGSQQPVDPASPSAKNEADGLNEIFLPRDVGKWNNTVGKVENAIVDSELVERLDALVSKGVFVWAVFDACHSATLMRGAGGEDVKARQVTPTALGIPQRTLDAAAATAASNAVRTRGAPSAAASALPKSSSNADSGGYVAFYAAQTTEPTFEERLPAGHPERKPYGIFGFALAEALSSSEGASYRQIGQQVLSRYAAQNRNSPTPLFSGNRLDAPVFGMESASTVKQWPIVVERAKPLSVAAGALNQLAVGDVLAVLPSPLAKTEAALGFVRIDKLEVLNATLSPVAHEGKAVFDAATLPAGAYVRQVSQQLNLLLRVQTPPAASIGLKNSLDALKKAAPRGVNVQWLEASAAGAALDLRLHEEDGLLWLLAPSGALVKTGSNKTASIAINQAEFADKLADSLQRIGKALNLLRIASQLEGGAAARNLEVALVFKRKDGSAIAPSAVPTLADGDKVTLSIRNKGRTAIDITALYVDGDYGIGVLYPPQPGASNRLEAGASDTLEIDVHDDTTGLERLMLIAVEAKAGADRYDFSFMAQARLERTRSVGAGADAITDAFTAAGFGFDALTTRSAKPALPGRTEMRLYQWQVTK